MPLNLRIKSTRRSTGPACPLCREEEADLTMGCAASTPVIRHAALNDWYPPLSKGISMATHAQDHMQLVDDFQVVPLAGSRYGIMKVEAPSEGRENSKGILHGDFMREALKRFESLDQESDSGGFQSWREPTSMLEDLKPGLEKYLNDICGVKEGVMTNTGNNFIARVQSGGEDDSKAFSDEAARILEGEKVLNKERSSPLQRRDQRGRIDCKSYISPLTTPTDRSKNSKSFRGVRSFSKLFSFGSQAKRESKSARNGKTGGGDVASQKNFPEDCAISVSEPRSSLFDADFLTSFEDVMKQLTLNDRDSFQSHDTRTDSFASADTYNIQLFDAEVKGSEGSEGRDSESEVLTPSSVDSSPVVTKRTPAAKRPEAKKVDPLEKFEKVDLPGGEKAVVLYTTSLRGVRKTFEDCSNVRAVLESFQVSIDERDISMHKDFRNELREMMGKPVPVPQLFIKGRYIGDVEEVLELHEEGQLAELLESMPQDKAYGRVCDGCGGVRFVPCLECSGSRKLVDDEDELVRCPHCNENGLIQCPICFF